jgi:adenosylhomocysteine nucleosidase
MTSNQTMRLGVISALDDEQQGLVAAMQGTTRLTHGMRDYTMGNLWGIDAVCVLSRMGKVAAAMTAAILVDKFEVTHVIFTGVAGSADAAVVVGDVVVADLLVQHDMDVRPLFPRFQVPLTGQSHFQPDRSLSERLALAASDFLQRDAAADSGHNQQARRAQVRRGLIASGDQFISSRTHLRELKAALPDLLAVEMEGGAVAQVCFELGIPFAVIRTISDIANEEAAIDFMYFVKTVAARYALGIVQGLCTDLAKDQP